MISNRPMMIPLFSNTIVNYQLSIIIKLGLNIKCFPKSHNYMKKQIRFT